MLETKPGQAVSIIECDMNVSFYSPKERVHEITVEPVLSGHSKRTQKLVFKTDYRLMQVKSIAECSKLPFFIKTFVLYIFEWPLKTGFTVSHWQP